PREPCRRLRKGHRLDRPRRRGRMRNPADPPRAPVRESPQRSEVRTSAPAQTAEEGLIRVLKKGGMMYQRRNWLLVPGVSIFLLVVSLRGPTATKTASAQAQVQSAGGTAVAISLTLDPQTNKVTASPDPAALHYDKMEYADWQIAKGSAPFDFTI